MVGNLGAADCLSCVSQTSARNCICQAIVFVKCAQLYLSVRQVCTIVFVNHPSRRFTKPYSDVEKRTHVVFQSRNHWLVSPHLKVVLQGVRSILIYLIYSITFKEEGAIKMKHIL